MLVLSRKVGESFVIGDKIVVTVVRIAGGGVRIGIEAPAECAVMRHELCESAASTHPPLNASQLAPDSQSGAGPAQSKAS